MAPDGAKIGTLATKDGRAWGLGAFLRQHGARIDDHILLTLDLQQRTATVLDTVAVAPGPGNDRRCNGELRIWGRCERPSASLVAYRWHLAFCLRRS